MHFRQNKTQNWEIRRKMQVENATLRFIKDYRKMAMSEHSMKING